MNPVSEKVLVNVLKLTFRAEAFRTNLFDQPWFLDPKCTSTVATLKRLYQASAIYIEGIVFVLFAIFCENDSSIGSLSFGQPLSFLWDVL